MLWLLTQLGVLGQGANRPERTPIFVGLFPANLVPRVDPIQHRATKTVENVVGFAFDKVVQKSSINLRCDRC